jgi:crotonobetainyl-CoA:carnitine CoA-transferase CaiB-like acyl-CoA transferase
MADPVVRAQGLSVTQQAEDVGEVTMPGLSVHLSDTPMRLGTAARRPGADAESILQDIGLADEMGRLERVWALQTANLPSAW